VSAFAEICSRLAGCVGHLEAPPRRWWTKKLPKKARLCYRKKTDALNVFLDENYKLVERWGGPDIKAGCSEFDAVNHKHGLKKKKCAKTIADAVWLSLRGSGHRGGPPYCLDEIDLESLNDTAPGQLYNGFRLPPKAHEEVLRREEERYYEEQMMDEGMFDTCSTVYRHKKSGRFKSTRNGRVRQCQCRDERGRFKKCGREEEVPF
jgi:hypothetical protein